MSVCTLHVPYCSSRLVSHVDTEFHCYSRHPDWHQCFACREHPLISFFVFAAHRIQNTHTKSDQMFLSVWVNFCSAPPVDVCLRLFHMISFPSLHPEPFFFFFFFHSKPVVCGSLSVCLFDAAKRICTSVYSTAPLTVVVPRDNCIFFRLRSLNIHTPCLLLTDSLCLTVFSCCSISSSPVLLLNQQNRRWNAMA